MSKKNVYIINEKSTYPNKTVYLIFDDGPTEWTNEILDILKSKNIKATWFMNSCSWASTGEFAK